MQPAEDASDFLRRPMGRYLIRSTWIAFCASDAVSGFMVWGSPDATQTTSLMEVIAARGSVLAFPMARWVDLRRLEPGPDIFSAFADYFVANADILGKAVTRVAVLHSGALMRAVVAGFHEVVSAPYPIRALGEPVEALSWLGIAGEPRFVRELDELYAFATGTSPLLSQLRSWLTARLRNPSLRNAAAAMGSSQRSLQRRLLEQGTSFQRELCTLRIEVAKRLLLDIDKPIKAIAYAVGCASTYHFGEVFRRETGHNPSEFRASFSPAAALHAGGRRDARTCDLACTGASGAPRGCSTRSCRDSCIDWRARSDFVCKVNPSIGANVHDRATPNQNNWRII
jgi:AraC-like DNA-binding protein